MLHDAAPAGKERRYARLELERRFLFRAVPPGDAVRTVGIVDRYLTGTRLRLRAATDGGATTYKLTQKVPAPDGAPGLITTMYLTAAEHDVVGRLPGAVLRKTRLSVPPLGVDVFEGELAGLVLGEVEFDDAAALAAFEQPPDAVAEVTRDVRLTGGRLAVTTAVELAATLRSYGVRLPW